jgi:hypothetical protein
MNCKPFFILAISAIAISLTSIANAQGIKVLYLMPREAGGAKDTLKDLLGGDSRFDLTNSALRDDLPSVEEMLKYDVVLATADYGPIEGSGDRYADYVDAGGRIAMSTFTGFYSSVGVLGGRINESGYNPLTDPTTKAFQSASLGKFNGNHEIMKGVKELKSNLFNGDWTGVDKGADVVAYWDNGSPLVAVNEKKNVANITLYPNVANYHHAEGNYRELFSNTLAYIASEPKTQPVPEPASMAILGMGAMALLRRRKKA